MSINLNYVAWENSVKGPLENLLGGRVGKRGTGDGGWGAGEVQKSIRARENSTKKRSCTPSKPVKGRAQKTSKQNYIY